MTPSQPGGPPALPSTHSSLHSRPANVKQPGPIDLGPASASQPSPQPNKETSQCQHSPSKNGDTINRLIDGHRHVNGDLQTKSRYACIHCCERNFLCSGYPGPCSFCLSKKPVPLQCTFPLKRNRSDQQNLYISQYSPNVTVAPCEAEPDSSGDAQEEDNNKRARCSSHLCANGVQNVVPGYVMGSSQRIEMYNRDLIIHMMIYQVIDDLKANHFLRPSVATTSSFRNQGYYRHWISVGVTTWVTALGPLKGEAEFNEFARLFTTLQDSGNPETIWNLDTLVLKKLFWLSGAGFTVHDRTKKYSPRMALPEFCLVLMWMGPADMTGIITAADAVCMIYNWITASKDRVCVFQGLCSRQSAISTLRFSSFNCIYHLNEGRMECGREFPADYRIEFFCRNLVCTSAVNQAGLLGPDRSPAAFRHDLMIDITKVNETSSPSVIPCPKQ